MNVFSYPFPRPAVTVDAIVFRTLGNSSQVLLIKRADKPFIDNWAFPGGFVNCGETVEEAIVRELQEETGLKDVNLHQFYTASKPGRDPRGWTISVVFTGIATEGQIICAGDDAKDAKWFSINKIPKLAFDHKELLLLYIERYFIE